MSHMFLCTGLDLSAGQGHQASKWIYMIRICKEQEQEQELQKDYPKKLTIKNIPNGSVWTFPHLFQSKFLDTSLI
jgi:hypothetical protein